MDLFMRQSLAESLRHIHQQAGFLSLEVPDFPGNLLTGLAEGLPFPPATFGLYSDLVRALLEERTADAVTLARQLAQLEPLHDSESLVALGQGSSQPYSDLYTRLMNAEPESRAPYCSPVPSQVGQFAESYRQAMSLLSRADPELHREIGYLVSQTIMVASDPRAAIQFDGGSCYMLWGGLFLNITLPRDLVTLAEVIVHESAHIMLYAFAAEEALVENDDDELYSSPLRTDERPMDGIYHATYVSARMHYAMNRVAQLPDAPTEMIVAARQAMEVDAANFASGYETVRRHGRLTKTGNEVMGAAYDYMASASPGRLNS